MRRGELYEIKMNTSIHGTVRAAVYQLQSSLILVLIFFSVSSSKITISGLIRPSPNCHKEAQFRLSLLVPTKGFDGDQATLSLLSSPPTPSPAFSEHPAIYPMSFADLILYSSPSLTGCPVAPLVNLQSLFRIILHSLSSRSKTLRQYPTYKMFFSTAFIALAAPLLVSAAPFKRAVAGDLAVLREC
jgi:hypothetical protein